MEKKRLQSPYPLPIHGVGKEVPEQENPSPERTESPRGFLITGTSAAIDELYETQLHGSFNVNAWEFRRRVLHAACQAIGDIRTWYKAHSRHPYVYGRRYDFLVDTLTFVSTGKRTMSLSAWMGLLETFPDVNEYEASRVPKLPYPVESTTPEFVARWCQQPDGFMDMLCSLNILYGTQELEY